MSARTPSRSLLRTAAVVALFLGAGSGVLAAPGDTPRSGSSSPAQVRPVDPAPQPAGRQKILDELFARLSKAGDKSEAQGIAGAIERVIRRAAPSWRCPAGGCTTRNAAMPRIPPWFCCMARVATRRT